MIEAGTIGKKFAMLSVGTGNFYFGILISGDFRHVDEA